MNLADTLQSARRARHEHRTPFATGLQVGGPLDCGTGSAASPKLAHENTIHREAIRIDEVEAQVVVVLLDLDAALVELRPSGRPQADLVVRSNAEEGLRRLRDGARVVVLVDPATRDHLLPHQPDVRAAFARRSVRGALTGIPMLSCRHPRAQPCTCRKPGLGLIERARAELGLELSGGWLIGDDADTAAGREAGLRTVRVGPPDVGRAGPTLTADYEARDLLDAANWILLQAALAPA